MGIGLAFCHKILQKMDSELKLSSAVNVGSTFNFKLNVKELQKDESVKEIKMNASISENINFNESLVSFAKPNNMFQSFAFSRSKNQNSNVRSSNSLLNNLSNNKLVRLAMPSRLESSNLFHKFKNHLYQNDENSYSQIMEISNNNFAIEKINSELFSNNAFKPFVSNQDKALISDLTYDIPSAIRNENTSNINSVPIFINCVKEGWKDIMTLNMNRINNKESLRNEKKKDGIRPLRNIWSNQRYLKPYLCSYVYL